MTQRALTALVGIPVLVAAIWWGAPWLLPLTILVAAAGIRELYRLWQGGSTPLPVAMGVVWCIAFLLAGQVASGAGNFLAISAVTLVAGSFISLLWLIAVYRGPSPFVAGLYLTGGPVYVGFLLAHVLALRGLGVGGEPGRNWLLFALLVTFATDTGAFFAGRILGKHRLAPSVSPNKTWEGAGGGFALAVLASLALGYFLDFSAPLWQPVVIGATVGVVSQWGDLFESKLKRLSQVKDAGSIIPGHGGILDRLDSIVVSMPTVYYLVATVFDP